ncbi:hypothetical protein [Nonomuraea sp. NPDC050643]|uniref:hypothetical protein n=1 Tax=Nonomuraea sp. NPDC050643 TaxID=3155660 RepID=UPI0034043824
MPSLNLLVAAFAMAVSAIGPVLPLLGSLAIALAGSVLPAVAPLLPQLALLNTLALIKSVADLTPMILPLLPPLLQLVTPLLPPLIMLVQSAALLLQGDFLDALATAGRGILDFLVIVDNLGWQLPQGLWNGIQSAAS